MNEKVKEDAEVAAIFYKELIAQGLDRDVARDLTSSYVLGRNIHNPPKQSWEQ